MVGAGRFRLRRVAIVLIGGVAVNILGCRSRGDDADESRARAVAIGYAKALCDGDRAAAFRLAVDDQANREYVERELTTVASVRAFSEALAARFGREAAVPAAYDDLGFSAPCTDTAKLSRADVRIYDATAVVCEWYAEPGDEDRIYELKKVGDQWKVWEVSPDLDILTERDLAEMAEAERAFAGAVQEAARDVTAGKYTSAQEAKAKLKEVMRTISFDAGLRQRHSRTQ
jgi:hypothetical protein